ncbi:MAG: CocE/NonD family hydrolase [Frankiaceae bacterium]|nr:CocE/NonD family hydrolase [Frankiaceae bacterium]
MRTGLRSATALRISLAGALVAGLLAVTGATAAAPSTAFVAQGSARQVYATGVAAGAKVALVDSSGRQVASKSASSLGGVLFRDVTPAAGYRVRVLPGGPLSAPVTVHSEDPAQWNPEIYKQEIPANGYGYLTTRDGTKLAYKVWPPNSPAGQGLPEFNLPSGLPKYAPPYPTLIEYSGYGYANPDGPTSGIAVLANLMGYAVVDVSMRGTGCSSGAFDFFEPLQSLDGYDVVETIARQPWVKNNKVGMMGISYGGISQLFTAQTHPPSLAAISPLSVIDATATTLYPGGIRNDGFAVAWAKERQAEAQPAGQGKKGTQAYAEQQIKDGDQTCKDNQVLHPEAANLLTKIAENEHYRPAVADPLDPITFVNKINVPTFMACQFQDEQTGGHCPMLAQHFTGTKKKWFTFTNGVHVDSLDPETYNRWFDFLSLYVARQAPAENIAVTRAAAPVIFQGAMGLPQDEVITLPIDPIQAMPTYDMALAAFEALPAVRVLFDNGAGRSPTGQSTPGNPYPGFEQSFSALPVPGTVARQWYLAPKGVLADKAGASGADAYTHNAKALPAHDFGSNTGGGGLWGNASQWSWDWKQYPAGTAVSYLTEPLAASTTVVGAGAVHLWVRSSTPDVDLMATVSEVTADGHETFVQNGWLRASERKLATGSDNIFKQKSTLLEPVLSMLAADAQPMPSNAFVPVVIPLYYQGHAYRAGTKIRVTIAAPNGTQPIWSFDGTRPNGPGTVSIAFSPKMPSSLVLPVVPGVTVSTGQPACPSLRNEPCRPYVALANRAGTQGVSSQPAAAPPAAAPGSLPTTGGGSRSAWAGLLAMLLAAVVAARHRWLARVSL